jgi:replicative DNA helicase
MSRKSKTKHKHSKSFTHIREALDQFIFDMDKLQSDPIFGVSPESGYKFINQLLGGQNAPRFSIINAAEKYWTTALGASIIAELTSQFNRTIGCFTLSVSRSYFTGVLLSIVADVDLHLMRSGRLGSERWPDLAKACRELVAVELYIEDTRPFTVNAFRKQAQKMVNKSKIDLFVIDNLQYISYKKYYKSMARNYRKICQSLKDISVELNVSILLLSQFSDKYDPDDIDVTNEGGSFPFLQDFGKIPDAELCLIPGKQDREDRYFTLHICRNREGVTGTIDLKQNLSGGGFEQYWE